MNMFERALGHGPEGATYRSPTSARRTVSERTRSWLWYRFGIGHRPKPRFEPPRSSRDGGA